MRNTVTAVWTVSLILAVTFPLLMFEGVAWADQGGVKKVDCDKGQTIAHALQEADGNPITIKVEGTCNENVLITRNDVRLVAGPAGATVNGPDPNTSTITVVADRVRIDGLTVTGGLNGIVAVGTGRLTVLNCLVQNTGRNGISFFQGGSGTVDNCTVQGAGRHGVTIEGASATVINSTISGNTQTGVLVVNAGSARIGITNLNQFAGNTISNNQSNGIHVAIGGSAFIGGNTISGNGTNSTAVFGRFGIGVFQASATLAGNNSVQNNAASGVFVRAGSVLIGDPGFGLPTANTISGNGFGDPTKAGIFAFAGGMIDVRNATITGNSGAGAQAFLNGVIELRSSTASSNIFASAGFNGGHGVIAGLRSTARLRGGTTVQNNAGDGIQIFTGSAVDFRGAPDPVSIVTGNGGFGLQCFGTEASFSGDTSGIAPAPSNTSGAISPGCTGF